MITHYLSNNQKVKLIAGYRFSLKEVSQVFFNVIIKIGKIVDEIIFSYLMWGSENCYSPLEQ